MTFSFDSYGTNTLKECGAKRTVVRPPGIGQNPQNLTSGGASWLWLYVCHVARMLRAFIKFPLDGGKPMQQKDINIPERAAFYMKNRFH